MGQFLTLRRYKIPEDWITLVIKYYDRLWGEHQQVELLLIDTDMKKGYLQDVTYQRSCSLRHLM